MEKLISRRLISLASPTFDITVHVAANDQSGKFVKDVAFQTLRFDSIEKAKSRQRKASS